MLFAASSAVVNRDALARYDMARHQSGLCKIRECPKSPRVSRKGRSAALMRAGALISASEWAYIWERTPESDFMQCEPFYFQITVLSASMSFMASYVNDNVKKNSGMRCVSLFFCNFALESAETNNNYR